ncbi:MAG: hypothetical protein ACK4M7_08640, partial [Burkholderiales bacterium]
MNPTVGTTKHPLKAVVPTTDQHLGQPASFLANKQVEEKTEAVQLKSAASNSPTTVLLEINKTGLVTIPQKET